MRLPGLTLCLVLSGSAVARAEAAPLEALRFDNLQDLRLQSREQRRSTGLWLFGWGAANAGAGALVAAIGHDREPWLAAGLTAASFGVINALLSPSLLDLSGARLHRIQATRPKAAADYRRVREEELVAQLKSGQTFAFNFGLDVAYITAGVLLYVVGRARTPETGWEEGCGLTIAGEGLFLLGFDLLEWWSTGRRAERFRALP